MWLVPSSGHCDRSMKGGTSAVGLIISLSHGIVLRRSVKGLRSLLKRGRSLIVCDADNTRHTTEMSSVPAPGEAPLGELGSCQRAISHHALCSASRMVVLCQAAMVLSEGSGRRTTSLRNSIDVDQSHVDRVEARTRALRGIIFLCPDRCETQSS